MRVRQAMSADVAAMSSLAMRSFTDAYADSSEPDDLEVHLVEHFGEAAILREMAAPGVRYFVADSDGSLAGLVKLRNSPLPDQVPADTATEIQQLYVDTAVQRAGVGQKLVQRAVEVTREARVGGIWLSVWTEADWATSFYRKCGFAPLGELEFFLGRTRYVDYLMWLPLAG